MSRTYRKTWEYKYDAYGRLWTSEELDDAGLGPYYVRVPCVWPDPVPDWAADVHKPGDPGTTTVHVTPGLKGREILNRRGRDRKNWDKPPKWFKQMWRRIERAQYRDAMIRHQPLPRFPRSDRWNWT